MGADNKDPLMSESFRGEIDGQMTDILSASFSDHNFVLVTQYRKFGTMIHVSVNEAMSSRKILGEPTFTTKVIFGDDREIYHVFARAVANSFVKKINETAKKTGGSLTYKPLLCNLALKNPSKETLHVINETLEKQLAKVL